MAARKKKTTKAVAKRPSGDLALPEELQDMFSKAINRDRATAKGAGGWPFVRTSGPVFAIDGHPQTDPFSVVAVAAVRQNAYYPGAYDASNPSGPTCFAVDTVGDELAMAPPAELKSKESELCSDCALNAWGSGQGRGKACGNNVKIAIFPSDMRDFAEGDGAVLSLPPTSLKPWGSYVRGLNERLGRPIFAIHTTFEKVPGESGGFTINIKPGDLIDDREQLEALNHRATTDAWATIITPPSAGGDEGRSRPKTTRKRRKVAAKKRTAKR